MKSYWSGKGEQSVVQNILLKASRIVIPSFTYLEIPDKIHEEHQEITKCLERAEKLFLLARTQQDLMQQCRVFPLKRDNKPEPSITTPLPDRPWQVVATDLIELKGIDYRIIIDYISRYFDVASMQKTTKSNEVISLHLPDMGPRNKCDPTMVLSLTVQNYPTLLRNGGFKHTTNRPRFPQANEDVERGVRVVKNLLTNKKKRPR